MVVTKEELLALSFGVEEFEVPDVGSFRIRALTRAEALEVRDKDLPIAEAEQFLLSRAVVDPKLSEQDVAALQSQLPAGLFEPLTDRIAEKSGMKKDAPKSGVSGDGKRS